MTAEETNRLTDNRFTGCLWSRFDYVAVVAEQTATVLQVGVKLQFLFSSQRNEAFTTVVKTAEKTLARTSAVHIGGWGSGVGRSGSSNWMTEEMTNFT